ncbi:unnamed protein product [Meloidogyne enterolobii]|uniref:Uncharacterized protein n=1 Tax=Meloidogyne enterolobii TaxID=390850 RepID=A0ACB0Z5P5_MELEN
MLKYLEECFCLKYILFCAHLSSSFIFFLLTATRRHVFFAVFALCALSLSISMSFIFSLLFLCFFKKFFSI